MLELDDFQHILITRVPALTGMSSIRFARLLRDEQNPRGTPLLRVRCDPPGPTACCVAHGAKWRIAAVDRTSAMGRYC